MYLHLFPHISWLIHPRGTGTALQVRNNPQCSFHAITIKQKRLGTIPWVRQFLVYGISQIRECLNRYGKHGYWYCLIPPSKSNFFNEFLQSQVLPEQSLDSSIHAIFESGMSEYSHTHSIGSESFVKIHVWPGDHGMGCRMYDASKNLDLIPNKPVKCSFWQTDEGVFWPSENSVNPHKKYAFK
jgi:hypothetical protein